MASTLEAQEKQAPEEGQAMANRRNWRRTSLMIPIRMLEDLDAAAEDQGFASRADLIRVACTSYMRNKSNAPEMPPTIPGVAPLNQKVTA
ncbi:MAG: ribbon-helix-helix domain-containing protein [Armatimonadota bacterium]